MKTTKICAGFYQLMTEEYGWANIHRSDIVGTHNDNGNWWVVDIRSTDGELTRFGGIWETLSAAKEEASTILNDVALGRLA